MSGCLSTFSSILNVLLPWSHFWEDFQRDLPYSDPNNTSFLAKEITSELLREFLFLVSKERSFLVTERLWLHSGKAEAVSINSLLTTAVSASQLPCAAWDRVSEMPLSI